MQVILGGNIGGLGRSRLDQDGFHFFAELIRQGFCLGRRLDNNYGLCHVPLSTILSTAQNSGFIKKTIK
jgi:hypothetical protein